MNHEIPWGLSGVERTGIDRNRHESTRIDTNRKTEDFDFSNFAAKQKVNPRG